LLSVKSLTVHYGKSIALDNVSLHVANGSVVSIIGANGAGKSTILRAVSGLKKLTSGEIWFMDSRIDGINTLEIVKMGVVHIPEGRHLFPYLSVLNNLKLGATLRKVADVDQALEYVFQLFPRLSERCSQKAGTLSGGEQQMLAIGRSLMAKPKLLLMDEPSLGLAPVMVEQLGEVIQNINRVGVTILLVEQNVNLALGVASDGYVLHVGKVVFEGDIRQLQSSDIVREAFLGGGDA